jgi:hypothetical protein
MTEHLSIAPSSRRIFLRTAVPGAALFCLGGRCLFSAPLSQQAPPQAAPKHKFLGDAGLNFTQAFNVAYANTIPLWRGLQAEIGKDKLYAMIKKVNDAGVRTEMAAMAKARGVSTLADYVKPFLNPNGLYAKVLTFEVVENTPKAVELKVSECLWAQTYRAADAGDLGYILVCDSDFAAAEGFNPKMRMIRSKTLMQGHDCCNHRYVIEA